MLPQIPTTKLIPNHMVPQDPLFLDLKIVRCQSDAEAMEAVIQNRYQFQHEPAKRTPLPALLSLKGVLDAGQHQPRLVATMSLSLHQFVDVVRYDPADPPPENYYAMTMMDYHKKTQSDFKGAKRRNKLDFAQYLIEGVCDDRQVYLPTVSGWQVESDFDDAIFVAYDESNPYCLYGTLYLPKKPVMQADGQTQTASLFQVANSKDALDQGALDRLQVSLEIELKMNARMAGQSFADRNGRGSKKNKNLVIGLDTSSALSALRIEAIKGTVFDGRIADGRSQGASVTSTLNILSLNTMEQVLLGVISGQRRLKPERFKHVHVQPFMPYVREFLELMDEYFADDWKADTPKGEDPYRRLYVHGWAFAQKALACAYHQVRVDKLDPLLRAIGAIDGKSTTAEAFAAASEKARKEHPQEPPISMEEFRRRLGLIDWHRYRAHWIEITTYATDKNGRKRTFELKSDGSKKVVAKATNTPATIQQVTNLILSDQWEKLTSDKDEELD